MGKKLELKSGKDIAFHFDFTKIENRICPTIMPISIMGITK